MKGETFYMIMMVFGIVAGTVSFYPEPKPLGVLISIVLMLVSTYKFCGYLGYSSFKKIVFCLLNTFGVINILITVWLILEYRQKQKESHSAYPPAAVE